jgi:hypothetical protein
MAILPESPRYLLYKDRVPAARKALSRLLARPADSPEVDAEVVEITLVSLTGHVETPKRLISKIK